jgi:hypothetical protein
MANSFQYLDSESQPGTAAVDLAPTPTTDAVRCAGTPFDSCALEFVPAYSGNPDGVEASVGEGTNSLVPYKRRVIKKPLAAPDSTLPPAADGSNLALRSNLAPVIAPGAGLCFHGP